MTRIDALKDLLSKVETGDCSMWLCLNVSIEHGEKALDAFNGSLDAAKALHEAVLPGWDYRICRLNGGLTVHAEVGPEVFQFADDPARAWLIAILKALIAQEET